MGAMLTSEDDLPPRDRWARLRFAIIGPLLAAPPAAGELHEALTVLAAKTWRHPFTGLDVRFGVSTIERWLYAAKRAVDPVRALRNQVRRDIGRFPSLSVEAVAALTTQYGNHPRLDRAAAPRQPAGYARRRRHPVPVVPERTTLPQGSGTGAPTAAEAQHRRRHRRPRSA